MKIRLHIPLALCAVLCAAPALRCRGASPRADTAFVYRLPVSAYKNGVQVSADPDGVYSGDKTIPCIFHVTRGDTVFAARKGVVMAVTDDRFPNSGRVDRNYPDRNRGILVRHDDDTFAVYACFEIGGVMVRKRQKIYPDTPLGIAGAFDGRDHGFFLGIYRVDARKRFSAFALAPPPVFATSGGDVRLQADGYHAAALSDELICREMSRCEKKKYGKRKQPFPMRPGPAGPPLKLRRTLM